MARVPARAYDAVDKGDTGELVLLDASGHSNAVSTEALRALFEAANDNIQVVVLNSCYSTAQAEAIGEVVDFVVGMNTSVDERAAITFAASFYRAIGFNRSVPNAFEQGKVALLLEGMRADIPQLLSRPRVSGVGPVPN